MPKDANIKSLIYYNIIFIIRQGQNYHFVTLYKLSAPKLKLMTIKIFPFYMKSRGFFKLLIFLARILTI